VSLVLDGSTTLAWIYQDEIGDATRRILGLVTESGAWVPSIWRLEVANGLQTGIRRGRIDATYRDAALSDLALLDIAIDPDTDRYAWTSTLRLADRFRLTLYDAAYLELAQRRSLPLASLDLALSDAARGLGVDLVANHE
jgi:predicted nucleic acid-binding protein